MKLKNYYDHPGDNRYVVFEFKYQLYAKEFKEYLEQDEIPFEEFYEEYEGQESWKFGIHNAYQTRAEKGNFLVHGRHRKPMLPEKWMRWVLLMVTAAFVVLALIGYLKGS